MILIDATPLQTEHRYRGTGAYTAGLLDALTDGSLDDAGVAQLHLLVQPPRPSDLPLLAELLARGVGSVPLRRPRWPRYRLQPLIGPPFVAAAVRRARPRVYHATEPHGLARAPGVATVATLYDLIPLRHPDAHYPMRRLDARLGYARYLEGLRRADRLIAISEATKAEAVERLRIPPERIAVTPLAVDARRFYPRPPEEIEPVLARHGLRQPYFLHVGASNYHKNTGNVVRAFDLFAQQGGADHTLVVVGSWSPRALAGLRDAHARLLAGGCLRVLGFAPGDDLPALYSGADALVYPSLVEGFGLPVLEAMRCGTAVLTSRTSALPEVAGGAALYVDPHSVEEIAAALGRLAEQRSLRAALSRRGLQRAEGFTWRRTAEATLHVYAELL